MPRSKTDYLKRQARSWVVGGLTLPWDYFTFARHPLRIAGLDKAAIGRQSPDDAVAGENVEFREGYSYGMEAAKNVLLLQILLFNVIRDASRSGSYWSMRNSGDSG